MRYFMFLLMACLFFSCQREIDPAILNQSNSDTTAQYALSGAPNNCSNAALSGVYKKNSALGISNKVTINVTVTRIGSWTASSSAVNGISFSGAGKLVSLGAQTITLQGSGTPSKEGSTTLALNAGGQQCSFVVNVDTGSTSSPVNISPVANAGLDKSVTLPTSSVTLTGSGTDADGTIATYLWTKISGTNGIITNPGQAQTTVTSLLQGNYQFELKVTDDKGGVGKDTVSVTVLASASTGALAGQQDLFGVIQTITEVMQYDGSGKIISISSNHYPERKIFYNANLISSIEYWYLDGNGRPYKRETEVLVYDGNQNVVQVKLTDHSTNNTVVTTEFTYNSDKTVATRKRYQPTGSARDQCTFQYTNGNLTQLIENGVAPIDITYDTRANNFTTIYPQFYFLDLQTVFDANSRSEIFYFSKNLPTMFGNKTVSVSLTGANQKPHEVRFENVLWYRYVYN